mmetsp:Transcript_28130/g.72320  ORF Transcript_28130/g.72320 Transcript_28130/m.72320 type:complete len:270 (-) Transcript_28130:85-894(-)
MDSPMPRTWSGGHASWRSSCLALRAISCASPVRRGSMHDLLMLSHRPCPRNLRGSSGASAERRLSLSVRLRPAAPAASRRAATSPARPSRKSSASLVVWKRTPQLTSAPTLFLARGGSTWRSSRPAANSRSWAPVLSPSSARRSRPQASTSAHVAMPSAVSFFRSFQPTPGRSPTGSCATYARASAALSANCPSGLAFLVASLASSMLGPMPALAVQPVCSSISCRISAAMRVGSPSPVTSRKASSQLMGCTAAVYLSRMEYTLSEISW